ncbi:hypothetical protein [Desulfogranum mediterraneum]|uniref:hypothetical protein n=1 Tax=Desulfogranum mediterraneum TaxID=160661 RepID=UPI000415A84F|nr:hypothetical protein [Desulfogranum mediterraneum]
MDFKLHFERSWQVFTTFLPSLLMVTVVLMGGSMLSLGILAPVLAAGYMQSLLLAVREGRKPEVRDLFGQMQLFLPLLGFGLLIALAVVVGLAMLVLPGLLVIVAVSFFCIYMLPLMTDRELGLFDALQESSRMAMEQPLSEHVAVVAVYLVLSSLGSSMVLGSLLTTPFATLFVLSVYEAKIVRQLPGPSATQQGPPPPPPGS